MDLTQKLLVAEQAQGELRKLFVDLNERMWNGFSPSQNDWIDVFDEACEIYEEVAKTAVHPNHMNKLNHKFLRILSIYPNQGQRHIVSAILQGQFERKLRRQIRVRKLKIMEANLENCGEFE